MSRPPDENCLVTGMPRAGRRQLARLITPLRLVFWGGVLTLLDFNLAIGSAGVDVLPDMLGLFLLTAGLWRLASTEAFRGTSELVLTCVAGYGAALFTGHLVSSIWPLTVALWGWIILWASGVAAITAFCLVMRQLCLTLGLVPIAKHWAAVAILMLALHAAPELLVLFPSQGFPEIHANIFAVLIYTLLSLAPLAYCLVTIRQMVRAAGKVRSPETARGGVV